MNNLFFIQNKPATLIDQNLSVIVASTCIFE